MTQFDVAGRALYLSPLIGLFNGEVLTCTLRSRPTLPLVTDMLDSAAEEFAQEGLVLHTDQGWHYRHRRNPALLKRRGITPSMSRKGNCLDNAAAESFFSHLKQEFLRDRTFRSAAEFRIALDRYLNWYNHHRIKEKLGGLSPVEYRLATQRIP